MYISNLLISNYRNFGENFTLPLNPFTVIIGENNIGKTNLLSSIGLVLSNDISFYMKRNLSIHDFNKDRVAKFKEDVLNDQLDAQAVEFPEVKIELTFTDIDQDMDQLAVIADWVTNPEFTEATLTYVYFCRNLNRGDWVAKTRERIDKISKKANESDDDFNRRRELAIELPIDYYYYLIYGGRDLTRTVDYYFLNLLKYEFLDGLRDAKRELSTSNSYRLLYKVLMSQNLESLYDFKSEMASFQSKLSTDDNLSQVKGNIIKYLNEFSPYDDNGSEVEFLFSNIEIQEMIKHLNLHFGDDNTSIDFNGLGYNNLLFISLVLSYLKVSKDDHTIFRIITIEEPEAHLHPYLQKHLAKSISEEFDSGTQLIISTHSTHISSSLDLDNTVSLYNDGDKVSHHYLLSGLALDAKGKKNYRFLRKYLDATNSSLFYSRLVIFVEGISEMLVIPELFKREYGISIEKAGCTIVNVNGLAFRNFIEIVKNGYFIKCLVLTDSDEGTSAENRADRLQQDYEDYQNIIRIAVSETSTYEKDLISHNPSGGGKYILLSALKKTRPINWKNAYVPNQDIDVDAFFGQIEVTSEKEEDGKVIIKKTGNYKSEFAYHLASILSEKTRLAFVCPEYIREGFEFLMSE